MEWATVARKFDPAQYHYNAILEVRWLVERIQPNTTVLDVGCLDSGLLELLGHYCPVTGIDIRKAPGVLHGDIRIYDFSNQRFDAIVFLSTLEHIGLRCYTNLVEELDGDRQALAACHKLLLPSGRVLVTAPYDPAGRGRSRQGVLWERRYNYGTAMALAKAAGYTVPYYAEDFINELLFMELVEATHD